MLEEIFDEILFLVIFYAGTLGVSFLVQVSSEWIDVATKKEEETGREEIEGN